VNKRVTMGLSGCGLILVSARMAEMGSDNAVITMMRGSECVTDCRLAGNCRYAVTSIRKKRPIRDLAQIWLLRSVLMQFASAAEVPR
jgi:hypothetical protein